VTITSTGHGNQKPRPKVTTYECENPFYISRQTSWN